MESVEDPGIEVRTYFARGRNALVARAEFSELYAALYLHRLDHGIQVGEAPDRLLRDALAAMTLHSASRPHGEVSAWTVNFQDPRVNIFVNGDNRAGTVIGNALTENVKAAGRNFFYADSLEDGRSPRRSVVDFEGADFFGAVGKFYDQSEQRLARFFRYDEEDLVMISAQPDCDEDWLALLDDEAIRRLDREVELGLLESRRYRFECGCNHERMLAMLAPVMKREPGELFGREDSITVSCPRCGAKRKITREALEAFLSSQSP